MNKKKIEDKFKENDPLTDSLMKMIEKYGDEKLFNFKKSIEKDQGKQEDDKIDLPIRKENIEIN